MMHLDFLLFAFFLFPFSHDPTFDFSSVQDLKTLVILEHILLCARIPS